MSEAVDAATPKTTTDAVDVSADVQETVQLRTECIRIAAKLDKDAKEMLIAMVNPAFVRGDHISNHEYHHCGIGHAIGVATLVQLRVLVLTCRALAPTIVSVPKSTLVTGGLVIPGVRANDNDLESILEYLRLERHIIWQPSAISEGCYVGKRPEGHEVYYLEHVSELGPIHDNWFIRLRKEAFSSNAGRLVTVGMWRRSTGCTGSASWDKFITVAKSLDISIRE